MLGRLLMACGGLLLPMTARSMRGRSVLLALPVLLVIAAVSAFFAWVGITLATMNWDNPADYPPAEDAPAD